MTVTQQIAETVLPALATAVASIITLGAPFVAKVFFDWLAAKAKNERVAGVIGRLEGAALKAVKDVSATVAADIERAGQDGKFTPEERAGLKDAAVLKLKGYLGSVGTADVAKVLGYASPEELGAALATEVEAAVSRMKLEKEAVKNASPTVAVGGGA